MESSMKLIFDAASHLFISKGYAWITWFTHARDRFFMKRNLISFACISTLLMGILTGCGEQKATALVNTLIFDTENFGSLRLDYDAEDIHVLESDNDKVILKEYMNEDKPGYYARVSTQSDELLITEDDRPNRSSFESYIEIYIPPNYTDSISLHSTSGNAYGNPS